MTKRALIVAMVALGMAAAVGARTSPPKPRETSAQMPANVPANPLSSVQQDVPYGTGGDHPLMLDIYQPSEQSSAPRPAVMLIHGGGWTSFDKSTMHTMGKFLARCGFVAFAVDYRLMHGKENLWPAQLDDVQRAVRWVRANAAKYRVDADHIGAFGHSAGAQLAALLGMEDTRDNSDAGLAKYSSRVQAVVEVSGPSDFTAQRDADDDAFLATFFGGEYAQHSKIWQDASPVFHVSKNVSPFLIMHGTQDTDVPIAQSQELADKLRQAGASVKFVTVEDAHTFQTPEARKRLALETQAFFTQYLRPGDLR
jgi:acetyl esterase/lipase